MMGFASTYQKFFMHLHRKREIRLLVTPLVPQFISIEAKRDACAGYVVYLFQDDERKVRTEGSFLLSSYAEEDPGMPH